MKLTFSRILLVIVTLVLLACPLFLSSYYMSLMTQVVIFALFAMSLDLLVGSLGLPSLGHAVYFGVAAYTAGLVALKVTANFWFCLLAGTGVGLITAALFGFLAVRTYGSSFLMITLALAQVVWGIAYKWRSFTGGDDGLSGIGVPHLGLPLVLTQNAYYYLVLIVFGIASLLLTIIVRSPFGNALTGIRESESRMRSLGYNPVLYKYLCFVLSGGFASVSGVLFVFQNRFVGPSDLGLVLSAKGLLMVILGGAGTLWGAAIGAAVITLSENIISAHIDRWIMVLGIIYVVSIMFFPKGILGAIRGRQGEGSS
ncbi:MAG: branched-chain amino acid ABC transporter permease [Desulfomonilaceae bacterium]